MHNLTTVNGTLEYLKNTHFAASDVQLLSGGHSAFTYRAILDTPLATGEKTVILKHFENYLALYNLDNVKIEAQRAEFEYRALTALANSGLFDSNSVAQVPKPIDYDAETHTIFMSDLGSVKPLINLFEECLEGIESSDPDASPQVKEVYALASDIGAALGDFLGRYHNWIALPEQAELRGYFSQRSDAIEKCLSVHFDMMMQAVNMFGLKESWMDNIMAKERAEAATDGNVIVMGDCWINNILASPASENRSLRIYIVDWEAAHPAPPEFDIGEVTGTAVSFTRRNCLQEDFPLVPALHQAYRRHRTLDPLRIARATGRDIMGFGTLLARAKSLSENFVREVALTGLELLRLAEEGDEKTIREKSLVKHLFLPESQEII